MANGTSQDIHRGLVTQMHGTGRQFLDEWLIQMNQANNHASAPAEESHSHWLLALAGNLLWAASCFVPGAGILAGAVVKGVQQAAMTGIGKTMYVLMAHGGAVLGAGTVDQLASGPDGAPSGKDVVQRNLNAKRNELGENFHKHVEEWASQMATAKIFEAASSRSQEDFMQAVDKFLWASMFPSIGFEDITTMYDGALKKINGVLADFNRQYRAWQKDTAVPPRRHRVYHGEDVSLNEAEVGRAEQYRDSHPFNPKLVFDIPGEEAGPGRIIQTPWGTIRWTGTSWSADFLKAKSPK